MRKATAIFLAGFFATVALGVFTCHRTLSRGYVFFVRDYFTGRRPVLRWSRTGYPTMVFWKFLSKKLHRLKVIFYRTSIPELGVSSPLIPLPFDVRDRSFFPIILVKKEWFPLIMKRITPGQAFTVRIEFFIRKGSNYYRIKRDVKVLNTGTIVTPLYVKGGEQ